MSINTNETLQTKKLCPNLMVSALPHTDQTGTYTGETQSIWMRTSVPLNREKIQQMEAMGITFASPTPSYSQGSSFVYIAEIRQGANLKEFLAQPIVLDVRGSQKLEPLTQEKSARSALEELRMTSDAPIKFLELLNMLGVANKAQRIILSAIDTFGERPGATPDDGSSHRELLACTISEAIWAADRQQVKGSIPRPAISTHILAEVMREHAQTIQQEGRDATSRALAQDIMEIADQLSMIAGRTGRPVPQ